MTEQNLDPARRGLEGTRITPYSEWKERNPIVTQPIVKTRIRTESASDITRGSRVRPGAMRKGR